LKEREQRDGEVKSWEKEKKRWKAFKTELETEVRVCAASAQANSLTLLRCITAHPLPAGRKHQVKNGGA